MFMTDADIPKSISLCEKEGNNNRENIELCIQGIYMEIFQHLEPEDVALVKGITPPKEKVFDFCNQFIGPYSNFAKNTCIREAWPLWKNEIIEPEGLVKFCSYFNDSVEKSRCYFSTLGMIVLIHILRGDGTGELIKYCSELPQEFGIKCFGYVAATIIRVDPYYTNQAITVCENNGSRIIKNDCYNFLSYFADLNFREESKEFINFCNSFPDQWDRICLGKQFDRSVIDVGIPIVN